MQAHRSGKAHLVLVYEAAPVAHHFQQARALPLPRVSRLKLRTIVEVRSTHTRTTCGRPFLASGQARGGLPTFWLRTVSVLACVLPNVRSFRDESADELRDTSRSSWGRKRERPGAITESEGMRVNGGLGVVLGQTSSLWHGPLC
jgi:hypothetical protein